MAYVSIGDAASADSESDEGGGAVSADGGGGIDIDWSKIKSPDQFRDELKSQSSKAIREGSGKAAAAACTAVGAAGAAPICAMVGKKIGAPVAKLANKAIDAVYDGIMSIGKKRKKPPIRITQADLATWGGTPEQAQIFNLRGQINTLYVEMIAAYDLALRVVADKEQVLLPGSAKWPPDFTAKVLRNNGLTLVPSVENGRAQWDGEFLRAYLGIEGRADPDGVTFPIFDNDKFRQWEADVLAWGNTHHLVPPFLPATAKQVVDLPRSDADKVKMLTALVAGAQRWLLLLEAASARALTTLANNVVANATYQEMLPALRAQITADRAAEAKRQAAEQAAKAKRQADVRATAASTSRVGWIVGGVLAAGCAVLLLRRPRAA